MQSDDDWDKWLANVIVSVSCVAVPVAAAALLARQRPRAGAVYVQSVVGRSNIFCFADLALCPGLCEWAVGCKENYGLRVESGLDWYEEFYRYRGSTSPPVCKSPFRPANRLVFVSVVLVLYRVKVPSCGAQGGESDKSRGSPSTRTPPRRSRDAETARIQVRCIVPHAGTANAPASRRVVAKCARNSRRGRELARGSKSTQPSPSAPSQASWYSKLRMQLAKYCVGPSGASLRGYIVALRQKQGREWLGMEIQASHALRTL